MQYACTKCGTTSNQRQCPRHRRDPGAPWSPGRDRKKQAELRAIVLERDGYRCTWVDPNTGERCEGTEDLRACHLRPFRDFHADDPAAYDPANAVTKCKVHDRLTDPFAR